MTTDPTRIQTTRLERFSTWVLWGLGLLIGLIGLLTLLGWLLDLAALTTWKANTTPMSPAAAVLSVLLSIVLGFCIRQLPGAIAKPLAIILGGVGAITALLLILLRFMGLYLSGEHLGFPVTGVLGTEPVGYISNMTAFSFLLAFVALTITLIYQSHYSRVQKVVLGSGWFNLVNKFWATVSLCFWLALNQ